MWASLRAGSRHRGTPCFIVLRFIKFAVTAFFTSGRSVAPATSSLAAALSQSMCSLCVCVPHFGNSCNISLFIMIKVVIVICEQ